MRTEIFTSATRDRKPSASTCWPNISEMTQGCALPQCPEEIGKQGDSLYEEQIEPSPVDEVTFRAVLGAFCSGVTIVTFHYEGLFYGLTVSSFCSLSLNPPLVLICIDQRCQSHHLLEKAKSFAVNILAENDEWLARQFASKVKDKFINVPHHLGQLGSPLLNEVLATMECLLIDQISSGDHSIFIGKVISTHVCDNARPLVYHRSRFYQLT